MAVPLSSDEVQRVVSVLKDGRWRSWPAISRDVGELSDAMKVVLWQHSELATYAIQRRHSDSEVRLKDPWDRFYTPEWCVDQMVELVLPRITAYYPRPPSRILDPCAGHGVFTDKLRQKYPKVHITAMDIDPGVGSWASADESLEGDFLETDWAAVFPDLEMDGGYFDLVTSNPPFGFAQDFVLEALRVSPVVIYFLRQGFLSSARRSVFFQQHPPSDVFVLADRPGFDDSGNGDKADYAWLCWSAIRPAHPTALHWLPSVPKEVRRP